MKKSKYILISLCSICGALIIAFLVNVMFKIKTDGIFSAEWSAGDALNYMGSMVGAISTFVLSLVAYKQNEKLQKLEDNNYIAILYVLKEFQKQGIGTQLLNFSKNYVQNKTDKLEICADKKAVDFYIKNGFKRCYKNDISKVSICFDIKENNYGTKKI